MSVIHRRRLGAVTLAAIAAGAIWLAFFRDSGDSDGTAAETGQGVSKPVAALVGELSPAEQVDQVLLFGFEGTNADAPLFAELDAHELGGVLVGAQNWESSAQGASLAGSIRAAGLTGESSREGMRRIPPLIIAAQEGGAYRTFGDLPPDLTELEIGDDGSPAAAEAWATETAAALRAAGFDLNLAPVADVATLDSPIADRAFSDDPAVAASLTAAAVRGCRAARLACAVLHFPGLGAASQDTNQGPATVSLDDAALAERDLAAFQAAFAERVPAVVLSLAFYAAYDPVTPAALAEPVVGELLRDQLGYEGLAITDDLGAGAVKAGYSVPAAAVAAVAAGADMVRVDSVSDQEGVRTALLKAVESGEIDETRLADAAGRVLELKRARGLLRFP